jgi:hypothetical protein
MKKTQPSVLKLLFKSMTAAMASIFQSSHNKEFKRLKDFISS